jgi:16S rRNA processing protein RimM
LIVGRVLKAHGIRGEVIVASESDNPQRFARGAVLATPDGSTLVVRTIQPHSGALLVAFEGVDDRAAAEQLRGIVLSIDPAERRALGSDEYWPDDLIGLQVRDPEGSPLGEIVDVIIGAQDRLVVKTLSGTVDVPFVQALVPIVDIEEGFVTVSPIPGLFS